MLMEQVSAGAVVFDWNGTVVDDLDRAMGATNEVLSERGIPVLDPHSFRRRFCLPLHAFMREVGVAVADLPEAVEQWNSSVAGQHGPVRDGMELVLAAVWESGIPVVILSAASVDVVHADARRLRIGYYLSAVVGDATDKAEELSGLRRRYGSIVFVGDTVHDVRAGRRADVWTIALTGGYHDRDRLRRAEPDQLCTDAHELLVALARPAPGGIGNCTPARSWQDGLRSVITPTDQPGRPTRSAPYETGGRRPALADWVGDQLDPEDGLFGGLLHDPWVTESGRGGMGTVRYGRAWPCR